MTEQGPGRAAAIAETYETAQRSVIALVESLTDEEWLRRGVNYPERLNDEDEQRTVGQIASHIALDEPWHLERIQRVIRGEPVEPVDITVLNAEQAAEQSHATRADVLRMLRDQLPVISSGIRAIPDGELDIPRPSSAGEMTAAQRLERVLIGHITMHQGSIERARGRR